MKKKSILAAVLNIPLTYISIVVFGYIARLIVGDDPTFLVPLNVLLCIFLGLYILVIRGLLKALKIHSGKMYLILITEAAAVYLFVGLVLNGILFKQH